MSKIYKNKKNISCEIDIIQKNDRADKKKIKELLEIEETDKEIQEILEYGIDIKKE